MGYTLDVMRQSVCLNFNTITVDKCASFLTACLWVGCQTQFGSDLKLFKFAGVGSTCLLVGKPGLNWCFSFPPDF